MKELKSFLVSTLFVASTIKGQLSILTNLIDGTIDFEMMEWEEQSLGVHNSSTLHISH